MEALARYGRAKTRAVGEGRMAAVTNACGVLAHVASVHARKPLEDVLLEDLPPSLLGDVYDYCTETRSNSPLTARQRLQDARSAWEWMQAEYPGALCAARPVQTPVPYVEHEAVAASWAMLDQAVLYALHSDHPPRFGVTMLIQRFTGLRQAQVRRLRPDDLDADAAQLRIRRSIEKRAARGRVIPVSRHLVEELAALGLPNPADAWLVGSDKPLWRPTMRAIWTKSNVDEAIWDGAGSKAFRVSFSTNMLAAGVPLTIVKLLIGHATGDTTLAHYTGLAAMLPQLEDAVAQVPPLHRPALGVARTA